MLFHFFYVWPRNTGAERRLFCSLLLPASDRPRLPKTACFYLREIILWAPSYPSCCSIPAKHIAVASNYAGVSHMQMQFLFKQHA